MPVGWNGYLFCKQLIVHTGKCSPELAFPPAVINRAGTSSSGCCALTGLVGGAPGRGPWLPGSSGTWTITCQLPSSLTLSPSLFCPLMHRMPQARGVLALDSPRPWGLAGGAKSTRLRSPVFLARQGSPRTCIITGLAFSSCRWTMCFGPGPSGPIRNPVAVGGLWVLGLNQRPPVTLPALINAVLLPLLYE